MNYAFCSGTGTNGGDATGADGLFVLGPGLSLADCRDGSSTTVAAAEFLVGIAGASYSQTTPLPVPSPMGRAMARVAAGPLTDAACRAAGSGWLLNKGAAWFDGNYLNTLYNHRQAPNGPDPDCIVYHNPGFKAARSRHPGGANALWADGHVRFARDGVALLVWRAAATRAGGEVISADQF